MSKGASLTRIGIAYVLVAVVLFGWLAVGPDTAHLWLDALIADVLATFVIFAFSRFYKNSSFYDAYWSVVPPMLAIYWTLSSPEVDGARAWLVNLVILLWAVRLTGNWIYAWPGMVHEDWRYPMLKERAGKAEMGADLFGIHLFPTVQVFLGMLPVYVAVTRADRGVGVVDALAVLVGVGAVVIEYVADLQMYRFARTKQPGQVMDRGLWAWSRHPNYFGEVAFWVSLALFGVAAAPGESWWLFVGVLAMLAMFLGASIPMMEERSLERRPTYQDVIDRVPMLLPRPPRAARTPGKASA